MAGESATVAARRPRVKALADGALLGPTNPYPLIVASAVCMVAACSVIVILAATGRDGAVRVSGLLLAGWFAVLTGVAIASAWGHPRARANRVRHIYQLFTALAVGTTGVGQFALGIQVWSTGSLTGFGVGDWLRVGAALLGIPVLFTYPRSSGSPFPGPRLAFDSLVAGGAIAFGVWALTVGGHDGRMTGHDVKDMSFLVLNTVLLSMVLLITIRDVRSRLWVLMLAIVLVETAEFIANYGPAVTGGERFASPSYGILWVLGAPLLTLGQWVYRPRPSDIDGVQDRRDLLASTGATAVALVFLVVGILFGHSGLDDLTSFRRSALIILILLIPATAVRDLFSSFVRQRMSTRLRQDAFLDSLTGMANRRALLHRIRLLEPGAPYAVLTLDLDGFKQINDVLGPTAGDRLLQEVADVLREFRPPGGIIARTGGDEFVVLAPGDLDDGRRVAETLRAQAMLALSQSVPGLGTAVSVGVGRLIRTGDSDDDGSELSSLVESAAALRAAKAQDRGAIEIYRGDVAGEHERRLRVERRLRRAIQHHHIYTHAQPLVALDGQRLTGFEVLARWDDEELGPVPPFEFIAVAEQTGLVVELGEQLVRSALESAKSAGVFDAGLTVAINASPVQLRVPGFVESLRHHITRCRIAPERVVIEVTEGVLVAEDDPALRTLADLAQYGVSIAIDDFGTGYSALGYLRRLPVQVLKIDKSLTWSLLTEERTVAIVDGVIRIAHRMGVEVVMEGIEDQIQADRCTELGADRGQGWLFGRPGPWSDAADLVLESLREGAGRKEGVPAPRRPSRLRSAP